MQGDGQAALNILSKAKGWDGSKYADGTPVPGMSAYNERSLTGSRSLGSFPDTSPANQADYRSATEAPLKASTPFATPNNPQGGETVKANAWLTEAPWNAGEVSMKIPPIRGGK